MKEDVAVVAFVKEKLERGSNPPPELLSDIRRFAAAEAQSRSRARRWWARSGLAAASLLAVCSFSLVQTVRDDAPGVCTEKAIRLLLASDDADFDASDRWSASECLLALQDAPYRAVVGSSLFDADGD